MENMVYEIHESNIERLENRLRAIKKKCTAYGCTFHYKRLGETYRTVKDDTGREVNAKFLLVEADGTAKINDFEFIATVEHHKPMNVIRKFVDVDIPHHYHTADPICEHCNSDRNRKDTYIIRNIVTGEFKQVGKSCLKDYTKGLSAEAVAQYISAFDALIKGEAVDAARCPVYYETLYVLQVACQYVEKFGYVRTDEPFSTRSEVANFLHGEPMTMKTAEENNIDPEASVAKAQQILDWIHSLEDDFGYKSNLKAVAEEYIGVRGIGILVSAVPSYNREMERVERKAKEAAEEVQTEYVGTVGERILVPNAQVTLLTGWETQYGYTRLYKLVDPAGHIFTWKTANYIEQEVVTLKGTIKAHTEFRNQKQTELTRCKIQ